MLSPEFAFSFGLSKLSSRERQILLTAAEGLTDEQIALRLGISTSTVNSYWVRLRGKIGSGSRTELVGHMLRQTAREEVGQYRKEVERLRSELTETRRALEQSRREDEAQSMEDWQELVLERLPVAALLVDTTQCVTFANLEATSLLLEENQSLLGRPIEQVFAMSDSAQQALEEYFAERKAGRLTIGMREPLSVVGSPTARRVVMTVQGHFDGERYWAVAVLRPFLPDAEAWLEELRTASSR